MNPSQQDHLSVGHILDILRPLILTHSPTGHENEATEWIFNWMRERVKDVRMDEAGNIIARVPGTEEGTPVALLAHKDELGFIIKRIEPDGRLRVGKVGGSYPWKYGEGPVDLLGDGEPTPAFLCFGSMHASEESREIHAAKNNSPLKWDMVWVDAKCSPDELAARGIHVGVKGVVSRSRKTLVEIGSSIGGYALDDRALVAVMLGLLEHMVENPANRDVYLIATAGEEIGSGRAAFAAGNIPAQTLIALEVAPVLPEYGLAAGPTPVILYKDEYNIYDESVCEELEAAATAAGHEFQRAVLSSFGSDLSFGARGGRIARYGCIAIPCENTHGFEIMPRDGLSTLARTLDKWVRRP